MSPDATAPIALAAVSLFAPVAAHADAELYRLDPEHTSVGFLIGHVGYAKVIGRFDEAAGSFMYDPDTGFLSELRVTVATDSLDTGNEARDEHVRNADFLDVDQHPEMVFEAEAHVTEMAGDAASPLASGTLDGTLTLLGETRPISLEYTLNKAADYPFGHGDYTLGVSLRGALSRSDWGMDYGVANGAGRGPGRAPARDRGEPALDPPAGSVHSVRVRSRPLARASSASSRSSRSRPGANPCAVARRHAVCRMRSKRPVAASVRAASRSFGRASRRVLARAGDGTGSAVAVVSDVLFMEGSPWLSTTFPGSHCASPAVRTTCGFELRKSCASGFRRRLLIVFGAACTPDASPYDTEHHQHHRQARPLRIRPQHPRAHRAHAAGREGGGLRAASAGRAGGRDAHARALGPAPVRQGARAGTRGASPDRDERHRALPRRRPAGRVARAGRGAGPGPHGCRDRTDRCLRLRRAHRGRRRVPPLSRALRRRHGRRTGRRHRAFAARARRADGAPRALPVARRRCAEPCGLLPRSDLPPVRARARRGRGVRRAGLRAVVDARAGPGRVSKHGARSGSSARACRVRTP